MHRHNLFRKSTNLDTKKTNVYVNLKFECDFYAFSQSQLEATMATTETTTETPAAAQPLRVETQAPTAIRLEIQATPMVSQQALQVRLSHLRMLSLVNYLTLVIILSSHVFNIFNVLNIIDLIDRINCFDIIDVRASAHFGILNLASKNGLMHFKQFLFIS